VKYLPELTDFEAALLAAARQLGPAGSIKTLTEAIQCSSPNEMIRARRRLQSFGLWPDTTTETRP
jgi:hypothetical protein